MSDDRKEQALVAWRILLKEPEIWMAIAEQCGEPQRLANKHKHASIIGGADWHEYARVPAFCACQGGASRQVVICVLILKACQIRANIEVYSLDGFSLRQERALIEGACES